MRYYEQEIQNPFLKKAVYQDLADAGEMEQR
jgi:hypothetical protein